MAKTDKKQPYMPFYVNDWLSSPRVTVMTPEQRGGYIQLMAYCWASGDASLPDDDEVLAKLSGLGEGWLKGGCQMVRDCFEPHPEQNGKLTQRRLYDEWQKRAAWIAKSREGGRKSVAARKKRRLRVVEPPLEPNVNQPFDNDNEDLSSSSAQQKKESAPRKPKTKKANRVEYSDDFQEWWGCGPGNVGYPKKGRHQKPKASEAYEAQRKLGRTREWLLNHRNDYANSQLVKDGYVVRADRFLLLMCDDDPADWNGRAEPKTLFPDGWNKKP